MRIHCDPKNNDANNMTIIIVLLRSFDQSRFGGLLWLTGKLEEGLVQLHTGNGKGKTTAALGLGSRAIGHGFKVCVIEFMKKWRYGELEAVRKLAPNFVMVQFGRENCIAKGDLSEIDKKLAQEGLQHAEKSFSVENTTL